MPPLLLFVLSIAVLLTAIIYLRVHPFLSLILTGLFLGIAAEMPAEHVVESLLQGFADTLKWIGIVMVLGTVIGEILSETGGALRISDFIIRKVGSHRLPVAMAITGYVVAIPVFVDVAYIMLRPITESLARESRRRILMVGLSLVAGLTATHALIPPTPGPLAVAGILKADLGRLILLNGTVALCALAAGLMWAVTYCRRVSVPFDEMAGRHDATVELLPEKQHARISTGLSFASILAPLILMALASAWNASRGGRIAAVLTFLGTPVVALLIGVAIAVLLLGPHERMSRLSALVDRSIEKAAVVILITGAGGAFGRIILDAELAGPIASIVQESGVPAALLPFLLAMVFTTATGSLTISMVTTASLILPMLSRLGLSAEIAAAMIGAGALGVIHANSSFFWLLSRMHEIPTAALYRTFVVQSFLMALGGGLGAYVLYLLGIG